MPEEGGGFLVQALFERIDAVAAYGGSNEASVAERLVYAHVQEIEFLGELPLTKANNGLDLAMQCAYEVSIDKSWL